MSSFLVFISRLRIHQYGCFIGFAESGFYRGFCGGKRDALKAGAVASAYCVCVDWAFKLLLDYELELQGSLAGQTSL